MVAGDGRAVEVVVAEKAISSPQYGPVYESAPAWPALACNPGGCLAVWNEGRTGLGYRIWARRLRADGTPRDPAAFLVSRASFGSSDPGVATDGTRFLVAWGDGDRRIYLTRVDADDSLHSESAVVAEFGARHPALAFSGDGYLLVYAHGSGAQDGPVRALRADRDGHILDAMPIPITSDPAALGLPDVIWTGTQYLVVWSQGQDSGYVAIGARVLPDGTVLDPSGFFVATLSGFSNRPRLALGGGAVLLVAGRNAASSGGGVDAVLLDSAGRNGRRVSLPYWTFARTGMTPAVAWNGASFVVSWVDGPTNNQTVAVRVTSDGTVTDTAEIVLTRQDAATRSETPAIAISGGTSLIAYVERTSPSTLVRLVSLSATGVAGHTTDPPLDLSAAPQRLLAAARGDGHTLVVWADDAQGSRAAALHAARISDDGAVLDAQPIVMSAAGPSKERATAAAAWAGGQYLVAWWEQTSLVLGQIQVARVSGGGQLLDAAPTVLATQLFANHPTAISPSGDNFLVTWSMSGIISTPPPINAALIGPDGKQIGAGFNIGPTGTSAPWATAAADGGGYLAAWNRFSVPYGIFMEQISAAGVQDPPMMATARQSTASLALVRSPGRALLWLDGRRGVFLPAAPPFSPLAGLPMVDAGRDIGRLSWNGALYVGAAAGVGGAYGYDNTGVDVSLLSPDGVLLDPPTTVVDRSLTTTGSTAVGLGAGKNLVVYSRLVPESDQGALRVRFQIVDSQRAPVPDGGAISDGGSDGGAGPASDGGLAPDTVVAADASVEADARDASVAAEAPADRAGDARDAIPESAAPVADARDTAPADAVPADGRADAGMDADATATRDAAVDSGAGSSGSGCSCELGGSRGGAPAGPAGAALLALALAAGRRRRAAQRVR